MPIKQLTHPHTHTAPGLVTDYTSNGHATRYNISKGDTSAKYNYKLQFMESRS